MSMAEAVHYTAEGSWNKLIRSKRPRLLRRMARRTARGILEIEIYTQC